MKRLLVESNYLSSFYREIKSKHYTNVVAYFEAHGIEQYASDVLSFAIIHNALPVVSVLVRLGTEFATQDKANITDEMANIVFGDPDDAVALLTESSPESHMDFLIQRQMQYHRDPTELMIHAAPYLRQYYLVNLVN